MGRKCKYDWSKVDGLWGQLTDEEIAEIVGCRRRTVSARRYRYGIPSVDTCVMRRQEWEIAACLFGKYPDQFIAWKLGVTRERVRKKRKELGIKRHSMLIRELFEKDCEKIGL